MRGVGKRGMSHGWFLLCLLVLCIRPRILCPALGMASKDSFSKDLSKRWPQTVLSHAKTFDRIASCLSVRPEYVEDTWTLVEILLMQTVREHYPSANITLEGSNADGTALHGISDYDVWIDTPEALTKKERRQLFRGLLKSIGAFCLIKPRDGGIGRRAMKFQVREFEEYDPVNLDIVCMNMHHDIGLDEHDFPSFTRSPTRKAARLRATEHVRSCRKSAHAILMMKAFTLNGRCPSIPSYILNHFALRICDIHGEHSHTSSALFYIMVKLFLAFCELQEAFEWSAYPVVPEFADNSCDSEILLILFDLWKDCVDYDRSHPGATRSARLRKALRRASSVLRLSLAAVMNNDQDFIREHEFLKRTPWNLWSR